MPRDAPVTITVFFLSMLFPAYCSLLPQHLLSQRLICLAIGRWYCQYFGMGCAGVKSPRRDRGMADGNQQETAEPSVESSLVNVVRGCAGRLPRNLAQIISEPIFGI